MQKPMRGWGKRLSGLLILAVTAGASLLFNSMGQAEQPAVYHLDFRRGVQPGEGADTELARIVRDAVARDQAAIIVTGHTGTLGDTQANQALSARRAQVIEKRLTDEGVDADRITTGGVAGAEPLERRDDESDRAYQRRLARVDVTVRP